MNESEIRNPLYWLRPSAPNQSEPIVEAKCGHSVFFQVIFSGFMFFASSWNTVQCIILDSLSKISKFTLNRHADIITSSVKPSSYCISEPVDRQPPESVATSSETQSLSPSQSPIGTSVPGFDPAFKLSIPAVILQAA